MAAIPPPGAGVKCRLLGEAVVVERLLLTQEALQHWGLDQGDDQATGWEAVAMHDYVPHVRRIGEEKLDAEGEKR